MSRARPWHGVAAPAPPHHYRRLAVLTGFLLLVCAGLLAQLVRLQFVEAPELQRAAERVRLRKEYFTPRRGEIRDRHGETLARSDLVKTVKADPSLVGPHYAGFLADRLAGPLGMESDELAAILARATRTNAQHNVEAVRYAQVKRGVSPEQWALVRSNLAELDPKAVYPGLPASTKEKRRLFSAFRAALAVEPVDDQVRIYPRASLAAHLLGFVGHNPRAESNLSFYRTTGVEGLELSLNSVLEGVGGWRIKRIIRRGSKAFYEYEENFDPRPGRHVVLTLDAPLQAAVETILEAAWAEHSPAALSAVVVDPRTGEILALANRPTFDPNLLRDSSDEDRRNRAVLDAVYPGSTFKVITFGLGLDAGAIQLEEVVNCHRGYYTYQAAWVRDPVPLGWVTLETALAKSSNIAAAQTGIRLQGARLHQGIQRFGIGQRTGIPLPAEAAGSLRPVEEWSEKGWSLTRISFGYEVLVTPLQMTMAVAAIANEGRLMRPLLVARIEDDRGNVWEPYAPEVRAQAISPQAARELVKGLQAVVHEGGTGWRAALADYSVAGKTGTADKWVQGQWGEYPFASFVGFFPAEAPRLCIGVFVDEPRGPARGGGATAAPIFREIAAWAAEYLGIPRSVPEVVRGQNLAQEAGQAPLARRLHQSRM